MERAVPLVAMLVLVEGTHAETSFGENAAAAMVKLARGRNMIGSIVCICLMSIAVVCFGIYFDVLGAGDDVSKMRRKCEKSVFAFLASNRIY
jgi:hypothetical protein